MIHGSSNHDNTDNSTFQSALENSDRKFPPDLSNSASERRLMSSARSPQMPIDPITHLSVKPMYETSILPMNEHLWTQDK